MPFQRKQRIVLFWIVNVFFMEGLNRGTLFDGCGYKYGFLTVDYSILGYLSVEGYIFGMAANVSKTRNEEQGTRNGEPGQW